MMKELGKKVRELRVRKGIGLNEFAKELSVSPGYLSNLETGKSDTVKLVLLEKLQEELQLIPIETTSHFTERLQRVQQRLAQLENINQSDAEFLMQQFENGLDYFLNHYEK
ncbi:helix-turn-helix domain-containing protein [Gottfriedia sp. NPDC057991]|uniref:helix-turn-helix domain-containing protein n=1 Tax=Gottfriedia sp. NPDC057991 TaxID=3346298 RepID=UPI0036DD388C